MRVVCVQLDTAWEDKPANHKRVTTLLDRARPRSGSLVVLPEMFATGFSMNVATVDDGGSRETERFLGETARRLGVYVVAGIVNLAPDGRGLNQALCLGPAGEELARYNKIHPFSFAEEDRYYARGETVSTFACEGFITAPFVCYDLRFPEVFRAAVLRGAQLLVVIASWPAARSAHWVALLAARAIENQAYVIGVNRCGADPNASYAGHTRVLDPRGAVIAAAPEGAGTIEAELDLHALIDYRRRFPALADISPRFAPNP